MEGEREQGKEGIIGRSLSEALFEVPYVHRRDVTTKPTALYNLYVVH